MVKVKIGTHNSLSYLKPKQWWLRPFAWIGRCQRLTIAEQWDAGVRYFDIRVKYDKYGNAKSGHGLLSYNVFVYDVLEEIDGYAMCSGERAVVRLFHENKKRKPRKHRSEFFEMCANVAGKYRHITFVEGGSRYKYVSFLPDNVHTRVCYAEYFKKKFCIPFPKRWAEDNNARLHRGDNNEEYSIYDFVDL